MDNNMSLIDCDGQKGNNGFSLGCKKENHPVCCPPLDKDRLEAPGKPDAGVPSSDPIIPDIEDITFLGLVREYYPNIVRTFLTGQGTLKNAMGSVNYPQIFSYLTNLWRSRDLHGTMAKAFEPYRLSLEDCVLEGLTPDQNQELSIINASLKSLINEPSLQLQEFVRDGVIMLAAFAEAREDNTGGHVFRIRELTRNICKALDLPSDEIENISFSGMMHDVGKIQIPDSILLKPGPLDNEERELMQGHCAAGEEMLGEKAVYRTARQIARSHHERWDGTGYPDRLSGESIPLAARIVAIADAFDALTHERCYKKTWPARMAIYEMKAFSGKQFDPKILDVFLMIQSGMTKKVEQAE
jgi:response regulator RpfG family c-di-GMP phosphodiesterase